MNNTYSLVQISQTSNFDANLISRQYKLVLMAKFMEIDFVDPRLRQDQIAKELGCSTSTI